MATKFGNTWWGQQWLGALEHIDYSNRIPRGARYARNGMVRDINFVGNVITASVQGSRRSPYKQVLALERFDSSKTDKLIAELKANPIVLSRLFNRELDPSVLEMAKKVGINLFPRHWSDLGMRCSCPDWAVPCKHLAAVIYKIAMEIDNNPLLVFSLHGVDLLQELQKRHIVAGDSAEMMKVDDISAVLGDAGQHLPGDELPPPGHTAPDFTTLPDLSGLLPQLLPAAPAFCNNKDFKEAYTKEIAYIAKNASRVLLGKSLLSGDDVPALPLDARCDEGPFTDVRFQQLLDIEADRLRHYDNTVTNMRNALVAALQLAAKGCIVPQIYSTATTIKGRGRAKPKTMTHYTIVWQPAMIDAATRMVVESTGLPMPLVCHTITRLLPLLTHTVHDDDALSGMFFKAQHNAFAEIGENNTPGGIKAWLARYFMRGKYAITFVVDESLNEDEFLVAVRVNDIPLTKIMTQSRYAEMRMAALQQIALLCDTVDELGDYINGKARLRMVMGLERFTTFLTQVIPGMQLLGVAVVLPKTLQQLIKPRVTLRLSKKTQEPGFLSISDLIDFDWRVAVGDEMLTAGEFGRLVTKAGSLIRFKERYIYIDANEMARLHKALTTPPKPKPGELLQAALSAEYQSAPVQLTDELRQLIAELTRPEAIALPQGLKATLRPYQERGFSWMYRNMKIGFGSIIADDMGLGKTLQVITLLLKMMEEGAFAKKKALVVAPTGLLYNWQQEITRFAPQLTSAIYHGPQRSLAGDDVAAAQVLLTSYGVVRSDIDLLKKQKWQTVVIDEAQNIKNSDTAQSKAINTLSATVHIAMSGTPVENRLSEFWSIVNFTNKGYLGTLRDFNKNYARPIQRFGDQHVAERFRKVTAPFMMRRLKTDKTIISDLPDKVERNEYATLTGQQAALYEQTVARCMEVIEGITADDPQSLFKRQGLILQMILALKQICNHPAQFLKNADTRYVLSGKAVMLLDLLRSIVDSDEKVLVFTHFREMGEIIAQEVTAELGEPVMFYHGGCTLKQREEMVERFQHGRNSRIFILSLKAAGTGLNLTAATHVIHYDLWWNPAVEAQATDRAYRIGQKKNVQVHRFITHHTFEERIDAMIQNKRELAELTVAAGESWIGRLSNEELHELLG